MSTADDFKIHDVVTRQVPYVPLSGQPTTITRVTIYVGAHGPFTHDFGPGQKEPATPEAINAWKQQMVTFAQSVASS